MIRVDNIVTTKCSARTQPVHDTTPKTPLLQNRGLQHQDSLQNSLAGSFVVDPSPTIL